MLKEKYVEPFKKLCYIFSKADAGNFKCCRLFNLAHWQNIQALQGLLRNWEDVDVESAGQVVYVLILFHTFHTWWSLVTGNVKLVSTHSSLQKKRAGPPVWISSQVRKNDACRENWRATQTFWWFSPRCCSSHKFLDPQLCPALRQEKYWKHWHKNGYSVFLNLYLIEKSRIFCRGLMSPADISAQNLAQ